MRRVRRPVSGSTLQQSQQHLQRGIETPAPHQFGLAVWDPLGEGFDLGR